MDCANIFIPTEKAKFNLSKSMNKNTEWVPSQTEGAQAISFPDKCQNQLLLQVQVAEQAWPVACWLHTSPDCGQRKVQATQGSH